MRQGELVPQDLVVDLVVRHITEDKNNAEGFFLAGFPRELIQAQHLEERVMTAAPVKLCTIHQPFFPSWIAVRWLSSLTAPSWNSVAIWAKGMEDQMTIWTHTSGDCSYTGSKPCPRLRPWTTKTACEL